MSVILYVSFVVLSAEGQKPNLKGTSLEGTWEVIAAGSPNGPQLWKKEFQKWTFEKDRVTFRTGAVIGLPRNGAVMDLQIDETQSPKRMTLSFKEADQDVIFFYCIFDQHKDTLLIRMLSPLALGGSGVSKEAVEAFRKSPYPKDFSVKEDDGTGVLIMRRVSPAPAGPQRK
jgi:uncharacterized protein (TIGR03067 family)